MRKLLLILSLWAFAIPTAPLYAQSALDNILRGQPQYETSRFDDAEREA